MTTTIDSVPFYQTYLLDNDAGALVSGYLASLADQAGGMLGQAQSAIAAVSAEGLTLDFSALVLPDFDVGNVDLSLPEAPDRPSLEIAVPGYGGASSADGVDATEISVEVFAAEAPTITARAPTWREPQDPGPAPALDGAVDIPPAPDVDLAGLVDRIEGLLDTDIPAFDPLPIVDIPTWDESLAKFNMTPPGSLFSWSENPYVSDLFDALKAKILDVVANGGTGLGADIEAALWGRALDRVRDAAERQRNEIIARFGSMGWDIPQGAMEAAVRYADAEVLRGQEQTSHEIAIEQARLARQTWQETLAQGVSLEGASIESWNRARDRALAAARAASEDLERVFNLQLAAANYEMERYKTEAQVFEARLRAAVAQLDVYRAKLDAQRAQVDIKMAQANLIRSHVDAVAAALAAYGEQVRAAMSKIEIVRARAEVYRAEIDAYNARWQGVQAKIAAYQAELTGDRARAEIYQAQAQAYGAYVSGKEAEARVQSANQENRIRSAQLAVERQRLELDRFKTEADVNIAKGQVDAQVYQADVSAYGSRVQAEATKADATARVLIAKSQNNLAAATLAQQDAQARIQAAIQAHQIEVEKLKSLAQVASQLAASIFSAINVGASTSDSSSRSSSTSSSYSAALANSLSVSENHNYEE